MACRRSAAEAVRRAIRPHTAGRDVAGAPAAVAAQSILATTDAAVLPQLIRMWPSFSALGGQVIRQRATAACVPAYRPPHAPSVLTTSLLRCGAPSDLPSSSAIDRLLGGTLVEVPDLDHDLPDPHTELNNGRLRTVDLEVRGFVLRTRSISHAQYERNSSVRRAHATPSARLESKEFPPLLGVGRKPRWRPYIPPAHEEGEGAFPPLQIDGRGDPPPSAPQSPTLRRAPPEQEPFRSRTSGRVQDVPHNTAGNPPLIDQDSAPPRIIYNIRTYRWNKQKT
ncbi:unnamed protein product [Trichogramma brassicae]|uniref:Uncharacterized protein n=1 Tax=Trichogramma brassicae TaxID=86971 RepID=A0A6H5J3M4_9HYME|nr:unnamed protein product [Trichogramma brassicae]